MDTHSSRSHRSRWLAAISAFSCIATTMAHGAATDDEAMYFQEVPAVYGASKYEQKITEAPASVSIVTAEEIQRYGHRTLGDILNSVRGLYVTYDRNYSYLGVRGFNRAGDYTTRVLLLVDGHRINDNVYSSSYYASEFILDVDLIDRVEVIRGPGSSLYGTGAFFAVVNVISKRGRDIHGVEASALLGNQGTRTARLSYGNRFQSGIEMMISASGFRSDGQRSLYYPEFDSPATNNGVAERADADQAEKFYGSLSYQDFTLRMGHVSRDKDVPTAPFGSVFNDPRNHTLDQRQFVDLNYSHDFGDHSNLMARVYHDRYTYRSIFVYDYPPVTANQDMGEGRWWGTELKYTTRLTPRHRVTLGWEYVKNYRQDQINYDLTPFASYLDLRKRSNSRALYLQDEITVLEDVILNAGIRHDQLYASQATTNPRLALIYNPTPKTSLKLLYGTAFRAPNAYEQYYGEDDALPFKVNPGLRPDNIRTTEAVVEHYLADGLRAVLSVYQYRVDDLITLQTDPADGKLVYENAGRVDAKGAELELDGKFAGSLEGRLSYTYQASTEYGSGGTPANSPRQTAKFGFTAPLVNDRLRGAIEVQYVGKRDTVKGIPVGGYALTNVTLLSRAVRRGLDLSAGIHNLFDKRYADPASAEHVQNAILQDGRTFWIKATCGF